MENAENGSGAAEQLKLANILPQEVKTKPRAKKVETRKARGESASVADRVQKHGSEHNNTHDIAPCKLPARRDACRLDLRRFLATYHQQTCNWPFSEAHLTLIADLQHVILNGGRKATAMPRGCGKTSICVGAAEWAMLYGHRKFLVIPAATQPAAEAIVNAVYADLEGNELLAADFPAICEPFKLLHGVRQRCKAQHQNGEPTRIQLTADELVMPYALEKGQTEYGPGCGARIYATGLTGHLRGLFRVPKEGGRIRPDLVLLDDPQTRESAKSESQTADRIRLIDGDVMRLAGHGRDIAAMMPCTVICRGDLAEHYLNLPNWQGQRIKAVAKWSGGALSREEIPEEQASLLEEYRARWLAEITKDAPEGSALTWYEDNQSAIEAGADVFWSHMYDHDRELSAYQHCLHLLWSDGEYSFDAEMQQDPKSDRPEAEYTLTAEAIRKQIGTLARGEIPEDVASVVAFVDLNYHAAAWTVLAASNVPCYSVVDYGWWTPGKGQPLWREKGAKEALEVSVYRAVESVVKMLLAQPYGKQLKSIAVDCGSKWAATVHAACKLLMARHNPPPVYAAKGFASTMYREPYRRQTIKKRGHLCDIRYMSPDREQMMQWDSHAWHMITQRGWLIPIGMPGSVCLFGNAGRLTHAQFADEASADVLEGMQEKGGKAVAVWKTRGRNEMGDVVAGAAALLSTDGIRPDASDDSRAARRAARKERKAEERKAKPESTKTPVPPSVVPDAVKTQTTKPAARPYRRVSWGMRW
ncbi:MAG: hypothetical protein WC736_15395 [Gallionella sp.]|jgi:hypothetical protein